VRMPAGLLLCVLGAAIAILIMLSKYSEVRRCRERDGWSLPGGRAMETD
jgi:hypothetical protein